jgi:hypothetical protein
MEKIAIGLFITASHSVFFDATVRSKHQQSTIQNGYLVEGA